MRDRATVLRSVLAERRVRRVELAFGAFNMAEYGVWIATLVYAYERGGATAAASIAVCQLIPAGLVAPLAARCADHGRAARALTRGYWLQAGAYATTAALLLTSAPAPLVYAGAVLGASAVTLTRPAQSALLPALVDGSDALTALSVLSGWVESVSVLAGPALAGLLLGLGGPGAAVGLFAVALAASALLSRAARGAQGEGPARPAVAHRERGAVAALRRDPGTAPLVILLGAQYLVIGVLDVLVVVLSIGSLGLGAPGAGYLTAAFGAGGVAGALAAIWLIGRHRLGPPLRAAALAWGLTLVTLGVWPTAAGAFALLAAAGSARALLDTSGRTILLRAADPALRAQLFGVLEGVSMFALALGSALVPALVALGGPGMALIVTGVLLSVVTIASVGAIHALDGAAEERARLLGTVTTVQ